MKRIVLSILIILMLFPYACVKKQPELSGSDIADVSISDEAQKKTLSLSLKKSDGQVVSCDKFTLALTYSGDILFTGNCVSIFREKNELSGCAYITAFDETAAGIRQNGTVTVIGKNKKLFEKSLVWTDIVDIALGYDFMLGLKSDGTVVSCGKNSYGKCETDGLSECVAISCGRHHAAALTDGGKVVVWGAYTNEQVNEHITANNVKKVVCGEFSVIALTEDGEVQSFHADKTKKWEGVRDICAYGEKYAALTDKGVVSNVDISEEIIIPENIESISVSNICMAVQRTDGTVEVYGDSDDMQNDTALWHTGVTFDENTSYITGLPEKTSVQEAQRLIEKAIGAEVKVSAKGDYVGTGDTVKSDGGKIGTILIYGDVTGDGCIDGDDAKMMKEHVDGTVKLTNEYEKASHVLHTLSDVRPIGNDEIKTVTEYEAGYAHINQYVHDPYHDDIVKYHNINGDTVGYIRVEGTQMDYPIMYGEKYYYSDHDVYKHRTGIGSIYSIYSSYKKNNLVLGHNIRRSGRMFHGLHKIEDRGEKLLIFKNRVFNVTIHGEYSKWELYAIYETGPREPKETQQNNLSSMDGMRNEQIQAWIDAQIARSTTKLDVTDVTYEDELLTMYTCGDEYFSDPSTQSRLYLFFRRVG